MRELKTPAGLAALKALQAHAKANGRAFDKTLSRFCQETLAKRLFASPESGRFVLKGGLLMCLAENVAPAHSRGTLDVDMQVPGFAGTIHDLGRIVESALAVEHEDGIRFSDLRIVADRGEDGHVRGGALKVTVHVGGAKVGVKLDATFDCRVAVADLIDYEHPGVMGGAFPCRRVGWDAVVGDKLHALVRHGPVSYRMRDYYDLYVILSQGLASDEACAARFRDALEAFGHAAPRTVEDIEALSEENALARAATWEREREVRGFRVTTPPFPEMVALIRERAAGFLAENVPAMAA